MSRRLGHWTYQVGQPTGGGGWLLDADLTDGHVVVLDFDPLDSSGEPRGAYVLYVDDRQVEPIDHYLTGDGAMAVVERNLDKYLVQVTP